MSESKAQVPDSALNPVRTALNGVHVAVARTEGAAMTYPDGMLPFLALPDVPSAADWSDAAPLLERGQRRFVITPTDPPAGWKVHHRLEAILLVAPSGFGRADDEVADLLDADVEQVRHLVSEADGAVIFEPRQLHLGHFVGIHESNRLVAMGGERFRGPGWTEISGGVVARSYRGRGLGSRLLRHRVQWVEARDEQALMFVMSNNPATGLFQRLGWQEAARLQGALVELA